MSDKERSERIRRMRGQSNESGTESEDADADSVNDTDPIGRSATEPVNPKEDWEQVGMYLPEELKEALNLRFAELQLDAKRDHDVELEKLRDYYPAVVRLGLEHDDLEDAVGVKGATE